jgi:pimeloyl-ACP methyl ester carboxylesterase
MKRIIWKGVVFMTDVSRMFGFFLLIMLMVMTASNCTGLDLKGDSVYSNDEVKTVQVDNITTAYRIMGQGDPLVMIIGSLGATMDDWDPQLLNDLSSRHGVVIFDNPGMGNTTAPEGNWSIAEFANDTAGLMDALNIKKANVLGWSMGTFVAQELAIRYPEKVDKLILYATRCDGGKNAMSQSLSTWGILTNTSLSPEEQSNNLFKILFPPEWLSMHPDFYTRFLAPKETSSPENLKRQQQAIASWNGTCDRLDQIKSPTLVVVGTEDVLTPTENAFIVARGINGSWLVQFKGGGHGLMYQYPDKLAEIVEDFISLSSQDAPLMNE